MKSLRYHLFGFVFLFVIATPLQAQGFGSALAVGEDEVIVGEPLNEMKPGVVYVYRRGSGGWSEYAQLVASDAIDGDHFGRAIALEGNTMVVGATVQDSSTGAAYVFRKDGSSGQWKEVERLAASDGVPGDAFGRVAAMSGEFFMVSAWANNDDTGAVYVFHRDPSSGSWTEYAKLVGSDVEAKSWFGQSIALEGDVALIGVPRLNRNAGAVYVFRHDADSGTWREEAKLVGSDVAANSRFGSSLALHGNQVLIGAAGHGQFAGAVFQFQYDPESEEWTEQRKLFAFDGPRRGQFSSAISYDGAEAWIGAPGAAGFEGRVYLLRRDEASDDWMGSLKLASSDLQRRDRFAGAMARKGSLAVVGVLGDDYGAGTAVIFERDAATEEWNERAKVFSELTGLEPIVGGEVDCEEGTAALFDCTQVDLAAFLPVQAIGGGRGVRVNDLWGWTDPQTGKEYALVGRLDATTFIDISDPYNPVYLGELPKTAGSPGSTWRDIKVYKDHAFIVADGAEAHGVQVFDLTRLRDVRNPPVTFTEDAHYDGIHSAHNIVINEDAGFAFAVGNRAGGETCGGGLHMINIREPTRPTFAGCFSDPTTGRRKTGYTHDAQCVTYHGPDAEHQGKEICFGSNETALSIADVTDKENPVALATASYPNVAYSHQGWLTDDHGYFFMDDEGDELSGSVDRTRTLIWDVTDLDDPLLLKEHLGETASTDHNLYIKGNYMYQANYVSGLRVLDISDVENPVEVGFFDTVPYGDNSPGFGGAWSNYPFFESGVIVVTSGSQGVFILKKKERELVP